MDIKNYIFGAISIIIALVMVGGALLPAVASVNDDSITVYNNEIGQYSSIIGEDMTIELTDTYNLIVNGTSVELITYEIPAIVTDSFMLKLDTLNDGNYLAYYSESTGSVRVNNIESLSIKISDNTAEITVGSDMPVSIPLTWGFIASDIGDYRAVWIPFDVKINDISQFYGANWIGTTLKFASYHGDKVIYGGEELTANYTLKPYNTAKDVFTLTQGGSSNNYSFVVDNNGAPYTVNPFLCIVPASVEGTTEGYQFAIPLFNVIPLIAVAGLVMAGVYIFISRK